MGYMKNLNVRRTLRHVTAAAKKELEGPAYVPRPAYMQKPKKVKAK